MVKNVPLVFLQSRNYIQKVWGSILKPVSSSPSTQLLLEVVGEPLSAEDQLSSPLLASPLAVPALVIWSGAIAQFDVNPLIVFILYHFGF